MKKNKQFCPLCKSYYYGHPALSRNHPNTFICSTCGNKEAILAFLNHTISKAKKD